MKILILEDEPLVAESLIRQIKQLVQMAEITGPVSSVAEAAKLIHSDFNLIIADIQLADGISIDLFKTYNNDTPVIFTTAFNEYAIRAFKLNSIDYLLKPVNKEELRLAFDKFYFLQDKYKNAEFKSQLDHLLNNFVTPQKYKKKFAVSLGKTVLLITEENAAYIYKDEIIYLCNQEGNKYICDFRSLDEVETLIDPAQFYRANRQFLINILYIESYKADYTGRLNLRLKNISHPEITVSKEKATNFKEWFES